MAHSIQNSNSAEDRLELASELAEVSDPVAIHAIELLLGKHLGVDTQMMDGLRAIGNNEARDLLRAYIQRAPSPEDAAYARSAIAQIDKRNNRRQ